SLVCLVRLLTVPSTPSFYTLSLHDALPISFAAVASAMRCSSSDISGVGAGEASAGSVETASGSVTGRFSTGVSAGLTRVLRTTRSEEHTSELQSRFDLVCRLLLEKKHT